MFGPIDIKSGGERPPAIASIAGVPPCPPLRMIHSDGPEAAHSLLLSAFTMTIRSGPTQIASLRARRETHGCGHASHRDGGDRFDAASAITGWLTAFDRDHPVELMIQCRNLGRHLRARAGVEIFAPALSATRPRGATVSRSPLPGPIAAEVAVVIAMTAVAWLIPGRVAGTRIAACPGFSRRLADRWAVSC